MLDNNYSLIDPDDINLFLLFYEHYTELITEGTAKAELRPGLEYINTLVIYRFLDQRLLQE